MRTLTCYEKLCKQLKLKLLNGNKIVYVYINLHHDQKLKITKLYDYLRKSYIKNC